MESVPEVGYATYMPGVYKITMVRMSSNTLTKLRMYGSINDGHRNVSISKKMIVSVEK